MIGRRSIEVKRPVTLDELVAIMDQHWDCEQYNDYVVDMPADMRIEHCIVLPGTSRFVVTVYPRVGGNFFNKGDQVVLSLSTAPDMEEEPTASRGPLSGLERRRQRIRRLFAASRELRGPTEEVLDRYTEYLTGILKEEGLAI